jgi:hypothetical protein
MSSQCSEEYENEVYPEGYADALEDCTVLAARLLKLALNRVKEEAS